ncbi:unnamed protein product [Trifolium pratense]|uniref:Uncharacterized protein n=1 Tax=Trifolium pratense TaxID=57577 RepID=A0ACB0KTM0_TRIPR|nr:unnamed protein product [Trifolium pratense]
MKIKHFIFTFFLCALIHISIVAKFVLFVDGATEEFKTKIEIDEWREWEGWRVGGRQGYGGGDKEGRHGGGSKGKGEHNENGRDNKIGHIGEGWELKGTRGWGQRGDSENEVRKRHP